MVPVSLGKNLQNLTVLSGISKLPDIPLDSQVSTIEFLCSMEKITDLP